VALKIGDLLNRYSELQSRWPKQMNAYGRDIDTALRLISDLERGNAKLA